MGLLFCLLVSLLQCPFQRWDLQGIWLGFATALQRTHFGITSDPALRKLEKLLHLEGARVEVLGGLSSAKLVHFSRMSQLTTENYMIVSRKMRFVFITR